MFQVLENSFTNSWIFQVWETCLIQYAHSCKLTLSLTNIRVLESWQIMTKKFRNTNKNQDRIQFYYYYYAAFNASCVGHKMTNRRRGGHVDLRVAVSVIKRS